MAALKVKFNKGGKTSQEFYNVLRQRVSAYFETNQISRHGDAGMVFKTVFMLALYVGPFIASVFFVESNTTYFLLWLLSGLGMSGVGLSIMHDANHGSYSSNEKVNSALGFVLNMTGGCSSYWKIQHNMLHHTYTNIHGFDEDISRTPIMRFSPHAKKRPMHRYQHYYAWFAYCLMTISWITAKEFKQLKEFNSKGLIKDKAQYDKMFREAVLTKIGYYGIALFVPLFFAAVPAWLVIVSFLCMHFVAGLILSLIFQPAHVLPSSEYPMPDDSGNMENNWAIHQIMTTANFSHNSTLFSWFVGGLNYQIEHHLFPRICHIHYKELSKIVRATAEEYNLPYHSQKTWFKAISNHGKFLKDMALAE